MLRVLLLWFYHFNICLSVQVHQFPSAAVVKNPGERVQVSCSHNQTDFTMMHWYQKRHRDTALLRIGHINYNNKDYADGFEKHFKFEGDLSGNNAKNIYMFIEDAQPEHSAVYYCAASYAHWINII